MQIDFGRTVANIRRLLHENRAARFVPGPIGPSRVRSGNIRDDQFNEECKALIPEFVSGQDFEPPALGKANWLGDIVDAPTGFAHSYPCHQWVNMATHCDGIVPHCCVDAGAQFPFEDVKRSSIHEIYKARIWRNLRERVSSRDVVYPCNTCNMR